MEYEIRHFDTPLLRFKANPELVAGKIEITFADEALLWLLPIDLEVSSDGVSSWIKHRIIPKIVHS